MALRCCGHIPHMINEITLTEIIIQSFGIGLSLRLSQYALQGYV